MSGEKSFCFLTFGQSHELETVGAKQLFSPTLQRATGALLGRDRGGVDHKIFLQSHIKSEPPETNGEFMHPKVKTGEKADLGLKIMQKKNFFMNKLFFNPHSIPVLWAWISNSNKSMCSPLSPLCFSPGLLWKSPGTRSEEEFSSLQGAGASPDGSAGSEIPRGSLISLVPPSPALLPLAQ